MGRFELYVEATNISNLCRDLTIKNRNQNSNFYINCAQCKKPMMNNNKGHFCSICNSFKLCLICHKVVKGLFVWCQICAHGGHINHIYHWFHSNINNDNDNKIEGGKKEEKKWQVCPAPGCNHRCTYTKSILNAIQ